MNEVQKVLINAAAKKLAWLKEEADRQFLVGNADIAEHFYRVHEAGEVILWDIAAHFYTYPSAGLGDALAMCLAKGLD